MWRGHENFGRVPAPRYSRPAYSTNDYYNDIQLSPTPAKPARPKEVRRMIDSQVHWCEANGVKDGHSFSSKDPDKERIVRSKETGRTDNYGVPIVEDEVFYLCGEHGKGLFRSKPEKALAKEIPGATLVDD